MDRAAGALYGTPAMNIVRCEMNSDILSRGRPFGGCSILYRKSLSPYISPLYSCSDRFCGVRV